MLRKIGYALAVTLAAVVPVIALVALPPWAILAGIVLLGAWLALTRTGRQAWSATAVAITTIPQRLGSSFVVVIGIAGVVGVLVALLAMGEGFRSTLQQTGSDDTAIVLRGGSQTEINSVVSHDAAVAIAQEPQVLRDAKGVPIASPEIVVAASIPKKGRTTDANVEIRGIGEQAWEVYPRVRIIAGAGLTKMIRVLGTTVAVIMAIGALFGALNTMYAAVSTRTREIATLRAIGFRGPPVVVSVLLETLLLALAGGLIGAGIAWLLFDNYTASTLGANFSQVVFEFRITPTLLASGLKWALAIGFLGGLFPALRAARMPVTDGLREL